MKIIEASELERENFNPIFINSLQQFWKSTKSFHCIGNPKRQNLLLYIVGCKITYTDKDGFVYTAESGDVVYTPTGSEYKVEFSDFASEESHTVGINFLLLDEKGEQIILSEKIQIFHVADAATLSLMFHRAIQGSDEGTTISRRITLLEILSFLARRVHIKAPQFVQQAARYLSKNIELNPSVAELASLCNVSEVYFRRRFLECMGTSPSKYKNELRMNRARAYLEFGEISVQEISDTLGYSTVSHFIKEFKKQFGLSPLKYRKSI